MTLLKCDECKKEISDKANACPHCGYPIQPQKIENSIQAIEKTGKNLKLHYILAIITWIVGSFVSLLSNKGTFVFYSGFAMFIIGILWFTVIKFLIWWNHK